jgi:hypothetical protein
MHAMNALWFEGGGVWKTYILKCLPLGIDYKWLCEYVVLNMGLNFTKCKHMKKCKWMSSKGGTWRILMIHPLYACDAIIL